MKKSTRYLLGIGTLLALLVVGFCLWMFVSIPSRYHALATADFERALADAKSVKLIEFIPAMEREMVIGVEPSEMLLQSATATPEQVVQLRQAVEGWLDFGRAIRYQCFNPHHRIEIVHADGHTSRLDVCFSCRGYAVDGKRVVPLPPVLASRLQKFLATAGMPLRTDGDYAALARRP